MGKTFINHSMFMAPLGLALGLLPAAQAAERRSDLTITGFLRGQAAYSLRHDNPNNTALGLPDDQDFNLVKMLLVTDIDYKLQLSSGGPLDSLRLFARLRGNWDLTEGLSGGLGDYNAFPQSFKDDWTLARGESEEAAVELWEGFADLSAGKSWLRIGRQNIVWGEADAIRLLDIVNPLDLTQHLSIEGGGEQFDHIRIPLWAIRLTHTFASLPGYSVDAFVIPGDYVPTALPDRGAPLNLLSFPDNLPPTFIPNQGYVPFSGLRVEDDTDRRRGDWEGGIRLLGEVGAFQYTLNYMSKIDQDGVTIFDRAEGPLSFDVAPPSGAFLPSVAVLRNHRKRLDIFGASFNWFFEPLGAVLRGELAYTPDQPYSDSAGAALVERDTTKFVLGFDRPTFVFPTEQAMSISLQWFQTHREGDADDITILAAPADKNETNFSVFLSQPIMNNQLLFEFLGVIDTDDAYWWQPQVRYQPGDHWRFALYANLFSGSETRAPRLGALKFADEVNFAITYQF